MRIELLQGNLPVTENPGLDSTDPRIDEISTLAQVGNYKEAASLSEDILADGIYDIRLICYFLYGHWLEEGLASLFDVIDGLNNALDNWEAIGPLNKREKTFEKSLDWLFKQLQKKIHYEEDKNSPLWKQWQARFNPTDVVSILELGETFRLGINHRLEDKADGIISLWSKIEIWLKGFRQLMTIESAHSEDEPSTDDSIAVENYPVATIPALGLEIESSYHMELLLKKLAAFERLLQEKKIPRAALVAFDINQTLSNFDPQIYFPKIFESFVRLQALNFEALAEYAEDQESPQRRAMQDWLKVNIDSFIND